MATTLKRKPTAPVWAEDFKEHLTLKHQASIVTRRSDAIKKRLKESFDSLRGLRVNENGSKFVDLPETIEVGGKAYSGMEMRRSVRTSFNEEAAEKILKKKGVYEEALSTYVDQDKIYRLLADDKISEKDLDSMFEEQESFAFWPVEGEVL